MMKASPTNAPTAAPRTNNSSISAAVIPNVYHELRASVTALGESRDVPFAAKPQAG
jgi:hypothetical protein